jgi:hypothetical protein
LLFCFESTDSHILIALAFRKFLLLLESTNPKKKDFSVISSAMGDKRSLVVAWSGKNVELSYAPDTTILDLKRMLEAETGVLVKRQKLVGLKLSGKPADDDEVDPKIFLCLFTKCFETLKNTCFLISCHVFL